MKTFVIVLLKTKTAVGYKNYNFSTLFVIFIVFQLLTERLYRVKRFNLVRISKYFYNTRAKRPLFCMVIGYYLIK